MWNLIKAGVASPSGFAARVNVPHLFDGLPNLASTAASTPADACKQCLELGMTQGHQP